MVKSTSDSLLPFLYFTKLGCATWRYTAGLEAPSLYRRAAFPPKILTNDSVSAVQRCQKLHQMWTMKLEYLVDLDRDREREVERIFGGNFLLRSISSFANSSSGSTSFLHTEHLVLAISENSLYTLPPTSLLNRMFLRCRANQGPVQQQAIILAY